MGTWLVESLSRAEATHDLGVKVTVLTRNAKRFLDRVPHLRDARCLDLIQGDVRDHRPADGVFTHVVHAATPASAALNDESPRLMLDTIVEGTRNVLEITRTSAARRLLFTSSGAVYGAQPTDLDRVPETYAGGPDPLAPASAYGEGKRLAEHLVAVAANETGLEAKVARCFAFVGPWLPVDAHFAVGNFLRDALRGRTIRVAGDGTPVRSYMYAADLVRWLLVILHEGRSLRAYNVGSDEAVNIQELARRVAAPYGLDVHLAKQPMPNVPASRYVPAVDRCRKELGLEVEVSLDEAIAKTFTWHRQAGA